MAIPAIDSETGENQFKVLIEQYDMSDKVKGICFDTTVSNTGPKSGTNIRFSKYQETILIEMACRRHVMELRCKHFWENVSTAKKNLKIQCLMIMEWYQEHIRYKPLISKNIEIKKNIEESISIFEQIIDLNVVTTKSWLKTRPYGLLDPKICEGSLKISKIWSQDTACEIN